MKATNRCATSAEFSLTNNAGAASAIAATAGTPQNSAVTVAFATAMQATVRMLKEI